MARRGRVGFLRQAALHDLRVTSAPGRALSAARLNERLLGEIDPNGAMPEAERLRRLTLARRAHFMALAHKGNKARRAAKS
jgi:hypothetical protein